ncbi:hypothetical protein GCM10023085_30620 [Actinomadura viridis]|uniref:Uncharacterized protein n=1 Tax=Actinomadura viridis TaxID=58110 RepID=A0A931DH10_9ACTN|nr:hypothetical protein [Actinomadura viridis]MBG6086745.1 hypothetical protein [Actinomadura viridis]
MRVYVPSTLTALARVHAAREAGPAPLAAYAVTPALREWYAGGDIEELEYAAMTAAARASLRLLAEDPEAPPRRVVLAAEVPDQAARPAPPGSGGSGGPGEDTRALVQVTAAIPWRRIASAHVDDPEAADDVRAAVRALPAARAGDDDALFTVEGAEGHELMWYATQELGDLLA